MRVVLVALLLASAGCSRPTPAVPLAAKKTGAKYQGKTAEQWAPDMLDRDQDVREKAALALLEIDDESSWPLLVGYLTGKDERAKGTAMNVIESGGHMHTAWPYVVAMLSSKDEGDRLWTAQVLWQADRRALTFLRAARQVEANAAVVQALDRSIERIERRP
jgi:hypothetical protein